ncbi:cation:proton antiporter [Vagococcus vulneris]|uniref:Sodium:proton antiporter n=1 Tax=Vagococcus vulneris TaxID=1977869 RepID=A0A429ZVC2_9ENTE|nr:cation:proton antiporter [Vagococcus vulneris]RST97598.1 sodium:proton antiporter [Vagococcus vulneris]
MVQFLIAICLILIGTKLASHLCHRINIPSVIGELMVGIILGPGLLGLVQQTEFITLFSEIGVILLMFLAGLESDLTKLKKYLNPSIVVALFGITFPMIFVSGLGHFYQMTLTQSIFLGVVFSATSVSISVQVLKEYKRLDTSEGSVILGAAVVDDIATVLIISIFTAVLNTEHGGSINSIGFIWDLLAPKILFFLILWGFTKFLLKPFLSFAKKVIATEVEAAVALILCFSFAAFAEKMGLSGVIGAFFIGLLLSQTDEQKRMEHQVSVIGYSFFIPVFFVSIGLNIDLQSFGSYAMMIILMTILATITKLAGGYVGSRLFKMTTHQSLVVGAGMVSRGEMALIIVNMGNSLHLVNQGQYSAIIVAIILTTLLSPFLIKYTIDRESEAIKKES